MAEAILSYALTTAARVKGRLLISVSTHDTVITRFINGVTDWVEKQTGRRFLRTTYTNEVYSVHGRGQRDLFLKNFPVSTLTSISYRAGTVSTPVWTAYTADEYELVRDGSMGIVNFKANLPVGDNVIRVTYVAGYLIAFADAGGMTTHTLPADLSDMVEAMVVRRFKRRDKEGRMSETFEGGTVSWTDDMAPEDKQTLNDYKRPPQFF